MSHPWLIHGNVRESCSVVSDSLRPRGPYSARNSPGQNTAVGSLSVLQGNLPNPEMEPRSPALQADSLPAEPPEQPLLMNGRELHNVYCKAIILQLKIN